MSNPRRHYSLAAAFLVLVAVAGPAATARAQVTLHTRITPDTKRVYHVENMTKQILNINGMDVETATTQFIIASKTAGKRAADGSVRVVHKIHKLQQKLKVPGFTLSFDSGNPDKKSDLPQLEAVLEILRAISKSQQTYVYDNQGKSTKVEGAKELLESLSPELRTSLEGQMSEKSLLAQEQSQRNRLLPKAVKAGDTWKHESVTPLEAGQVLTFQQVYTYVGLVERGGQQVHKVTVKTLSATLTQDPPEGANVKITAAQLKVSSSSGMILVDVKRGMIVEESLKIQVAGPLTMEINGQEFKAKIDLTLGGKAKLQP